MFFIVINNKLIAFTNCLSHTIDSMRFSAIGASLRYMIQTIILNINNLTLYLFHSFSRVLPCSHPSQWECSRVKSHQQQYTFRGTEPDSSGASVPPRILHSVHTSAATSLSSTNAGHIVGGIHTLPVQEEVSMFLHNTPADTHTHTHTDGCFKEWQKPILTPPSFHFFLAVRFCMWRWERFCPTVLYLSQCLSSLMWDHTSSTTLPVSHVITLCVFMSHICDTNRQYIEVPRYVFTSHITQAFN